MNTVKQSNEQISGNRVEVSEEEIGAKWLNEDQLDLDVILENDYHTIKLGPNEDWYFDAKHAQVEVQSVECEEESAAFVPMHVAPEIVPDDLWVEIA